MPRLKPPPGKKSEDDDVVKPLEVVLEDDTDLALAPADDELETDNDEQRTAKREAAREYRQKKKDEEDARATENDTLKKQLEEMRAAVEEGRRQSQEAQRRHAEMEANIREREQQNSQYLSRAEEAEYHAVLTAMSAAESEADSGNRDLETALTNGDHKAAADAQRRIARSEAKLAQLEDNKGILEQRKTTAIARAEEARRNPPKPPVLTPEQQIDAVSALLPSQKAWLKEHPDAWTDQRKNMRLQGAHVEAEDQGLQPGTKKYFEYLEERLGYKEPDGDTDDEDPPPRQQRRTLVSAPVSREPSSPSGKAPRTKITLTARQQEAAQIAGITPAEYAKNFLKLEDMKSEGYYNE